jgi:hypothetical protein
MKPNRSRQQHVRRAVRDLLFFLAAAGIFGAAAAAAESPPGRGPGVNLGQRPEIGLAALNLYNSFGCIGLAAEGWEAKIHDAAKVERIMKDVSRTSNLAVQMLNRLIEKDPEIAGATPIQDMIGCYTLLDRQAQLLTEAAKSSDERVQQAFHRARDQSWDQIKGVMGIEE